MLVLRHDKREVAGRHVIIAFKVELRTRRFHRNVLTITRIVYATVHNYVFKR
jgi:hypothetical protein